MSPELLVEGAECEVVVRAARPGDQDARIALVRKGVAEYNFPAFFYFFLQEVMLQCMVLCCAVLFIFFNTPLWVCVLPGPALAVATYIATTAVHMELTNTHQRKVREEWVGFVAEVRGEVGEGAAEGERAGRVVGTVSVSAARCAEWGGGGAWLHDLTVSPGWRGRGLGGALADAAARWAGARGEPLGAAVSVLQGGAAGVLQARGWRTQASYRRAAPPPAPAAAKLPVLRLVLYPPPTAPRH